MGGVSGGDKMRARLQQIATNLSKASKVSIGFLENSVEPGGTLTPMVAAIQEFGAPAAGIPPRPFMRQTVSAGRSHWGDDLTKALKSNDYDAAKSLAEMGTQIGGELRNAILAVTSPTLSPVTLLLRERFGNHPEEITFADVRRARQDIASGRVPNVTATEGKPLIWTGHMFNSVDYEVK